MMRKNRLLAGVLFALALFANLRAADPDLPATLETIRAKYDFPALAGAIVTTDGVTEQAEVGVRKRGATDKVTPGDVWSLGSDSKVITALLVGTYVAEGKLQWSSPIASFFPEIAAQIPMANRGITIGDVLSHSAGLQGDLDWYALAKQATLQEQRQSAAKQSLLHPQFPPGTFHYANADYVLIAAILERMTGQPWEKLMTERVFKPLHMDSAGFYRAATAGKIDEPWPHQANGQPVPPTDFAVVTDQGYGSHELPPLLAPAGLIHCSMADWAKFLADQLRGAAGLTALLPAPIYQAIQANKPPSPYAYGWGVTTRSWAGGKTLEHAGSDLLNYCVCFLAPNKKFGVLVCTNQGGDVAPHICDDVAAYLVRHELMALQGPLIKPAAAEKKTLPPAKTP